MRDAEGARIEGAILFEGVEVGPNARLQGVIVDKFARVPGGLAIGGGEGHAFLWFYFYPIALFFLFGRGEEGEARAGPADDRGPFTPDGTREDDVLPAVLGLSDGEDGPADQRFHQTLES